MDASQVSDPADHCRWAYAKNVAHRSATAGDSMIICVDLIDLWRLGLPHKRWFTCWCVRLHRKVLQSTPTAFHHRLSQPSTVWKS